MASTTLRVALLFAALACAAGAALFSLVLSDLPHMTCHREQQYRGPLESIFAVVYISLCSTLLSPHFCAILAG